MYGTTVQTPENAIAYTYNVLKFNSLIQIHYVNLEGCKGNFFFPQRKQNTNLFLKTQNRTVQCIFVKAFQSICFSVNVLLASY